MCLLITQNSQSPALTNEWLEDFFDYNSDGVGVMRSDNGSLVIEKILPKSAKDFIKFYREHIEGKACAFHLRMRTHGATDLENCHPYEVLNSKDHGVDLWLMHNGILHTDNKADTTKSDTWHYIRDYLRPMLAGNPDFAFSEAFNELISEHIGASNKFVLMDNDGRMATINKDAGVYWGGLWLSNTYAWSASNSASKTPIKGIKKARKQVAEKPVYIAPVGKSYTYYPSMYSDDYQGNIRPKSYDYEDALDYDIDYMLDQMLEEGFAKASTATNYEVHSFIQVFGEASFFDLCYMVIDKRVQEHEFLEMLADHEQARKTFSWLEFEANKLAEVAYD
jgi:hypothetical protein